MASHLPPLQSPDIAPLQLLQKRPHGRGIGPERGGVVDDLKLAPADPLDQDGVRCPGAAVKVDKVLEELCGVDVDAGHAAVGHVPSEAAGWQVNSIKKSLKI